jgi:hypothetical protein
MFVVCKQETKRTRREGTSQHECADHEVVDEHLLFRCNFGSSLPQPQHDVDECTQKIIV